MKVDAQQEIGSGGGGGGSWELKYCPYKDDTCGKKGARKKNLAETRTPTTAVTQTKPLSPELPEEISTSRPPLHSKNIQMLT